MSEVASEIRILTPGLTEEEIAAVTAVISLAVEELAESQVPVPDPAPPLWRGALRGRARHVADARGPWAQSLR